MKTRFFIVTLFVMTSLSTVGFAQSRLHVEVLGGASLNTLSQGIISNWGNGWTAGGGLAYEVSPSVNLVLNFAYDHYPYQGGNLELVFPAIAGLHYSVAGSPSNAEEASLGIRSSTRTSVVSPFLSLNAGVYHFNIGDITVSEWFASNPQDVSHYTYRGSGTSITNLFASVGFGLMVPVDSRVALSLEGSFSQSFDSNRTFLPLVLRLRYAL